MSRWIENPGSSPVRMLRARKSMGLQSLINVKPVRCSPFNSIITHAVSIIAADGADIWHKPDMLFSHVGTQCKYALETNDD